jgi:Potassium-transporting ATPase A subunit
MLQGWVQIAIFLAVLIALVKPVGVYMSRVFTNQRVFLSPVLGPIERVTYRVLRVRPEEGQDWKGYGRSLIVFSLLFWVALYLGSSAAAPTATRWPACWPRRASTASSSPPRRTAARASRARTWSGCCARPRPRS